MQEQMELPTFRYSPNAYGIDVFEAAAGRCSICQQRRQLRYTGSFYTAEEPDYICPWCIADGSAAKKYGGEFNDAAGVETPVGYDTNEETKRSFDEKIAAVAQRTPGYVSWQQEAWPSHCEEPCAFVGYADRETITPLLDEVEADMENAGYDRDAVTDRLSGEGSVVGYLFRCLHCGVHRLHVDSD